MKLNRIEFFLMNNPLRAFIQEKYEARILRAMSSIENIDRALEIGCGNGHGTTIIKKLFRPGNIVAIDLDQRMIDIARRNNQDSSVIYKVMDESKLDFPDVCTLLASRYVSILRYKCVPIPCFLFCSSSNIKPMTQV